MSEAELLDLAAAVAREAGAGLREAFGSVLAISSKSTPTDLVSEADVATETLIRERLIAARHRQVLVLGHDEELTVVVVLAQAVERPGAAERLHQACDGDGGGHAHDSTEASQLCEQ